MVRLFQNTFGDKRGDKSVIRRSEFLMRQSLIKDNDILMYIKVDCLLIAY
jgi:hypothetical protein